MSIPRSWSAEAFNQVPESENRIHSDEVAEAYGFRGALVPGVTVSAYLIHPAVAAWGEAWLERGRARVVVHSPVYDHEIFRVEVSDARSVRKVGRAKSDRIPGPCGPCGCRFRPNLRDLFGLRWSL